MKQKILFVCWGNICRSPSAEAVFNAKIKEHNVNAYFEADSAGTIAAHAGEMADARMQMHAQKRGYNLSSRSRKIEPEDFDTFDYIIAMDHQNYRTLCNIASKQALDKIQYMTSYCRKYTEDEVPDPYYGGADGFEQVLDLLEDAIEGLIESLQK